MSTFAVYLFGHNLEKIKYPYLASIASALALTSLVNPGEQGNVYYCECDSEDDSLARIESCFSRQIASGELKITRHPWGEHHTIQAHICNFLLDQIGTSADITLKLDADEVLCEWSFMRFVSQLNQLVYRYKALGKPHYTHFLDRNREWDFIYRSKAVLSQTKYGFRFSTEVRGDACALNGGPEIQTDLEVHHYGKFNPGREREALEKEVSFQKLYSHPEDAIGFPDPKVVAQIAQGYLDYDRVFDEAVKRGEVREYHGPHPIFVHDWLREMESRSQEFKESIRDQQA